MFIVDAEFASEVGRHSWVANSGGYMQAKIDGKQVVLHRFVWQLKHGDCPSMLDHINRVRRDCRLDNLRPATHSLNNLNCSRKRPTNDLPCGVRPNPNSKPNPYRAEITVNRKPKHLGCFPTPELASAAYEEARARAISQEERNHK
jgi:hypothetical protein